MYAQENESLENYLEREIFPDSVFQLCIPEGPFIDNKGRGIFEESSPKDPSPEGLDEELIVLGDEFQKSFFEEDTINTEKIPDLVELENVNHEVTSAKSAPKISAPLSEPLIDSKIENQIEIIPDSRNAKRNNSEESENLHKESNDQEVLAEDDCTEEDTKEVSIEKFIMTRLSLTYWEKKFTRLKTGKKGRGRPETVKDYSGVKVNEIFINHLQYLKKKQRSDAKLATVLRNAKKSPDCFLKYIGSK